MKFEGQAPRPSFGSRESRPTAIPWKGRFRCPPWFVSACRFLKLPGFSRRGVSTKVWRKRRLHFERPGKMVKSILELSGRCVKLGRIVLKLVGNPGAFGGQASRPSFRSGESRSAAIQRKGRFRYLAGLLHYVGKECQTRQL